MLNADIVLPMIIVTSALTFVMRYVPLAGMQGQRLRPMLARFLKSLPIGLLSALVAQAVFLRGGSLDLGPTNLGLYGLALMIVVASFTRNLAAIVFSGLAAVGVLHAMLG